MICYTFRLRMWLSRILYHWKWRVCLSRLVLSTHLGLVTASLKKRSIGSGGFLPSWLRLFTRILGLCFVVPGGSIGHGLQSSSHSRSLFSGWKRFYPTLIVISFIFKICFIMAQFSYFDFELACSNLFPASPLSDEWTITEFIPFLWGFYQCLGGYHTVHSLHAWTMTLVVSRYASIRSMCSCLRRDEPVNRVEWYEDDLPTDTADHFVEYCISLFESVI